MSTFAIADPSFHPLMLSSRLISELAQARSTLRATTERCDMAVIVSTGFFIRGAKSAWSPPGGGGSRKYPPSRKIAVFSLSCINVVRITPSAEPMLTPR